MHASACTDRLIFTNAFRFLRRDLCDSFCRTDSRLFENKKRPFHPLAKLRLLDRLDRFFVEVLSGPCSSAPALFASRLVYRTARKPSPDSEARIALKGHAG
jgi:hypothetical protein